MSDSCYSAKQAGHTYSELGVGLLPLRGLSARGLRASSGLGNFPLWLGKKNSVYLNLCGSGTVLPPGQVWPSVWPGRGGPPSRQKAPVQWCLFSFFFFFGGARLWSKETRSDGETQLNLKQALFQPQVWGSSPS